MAEVGKLTWLTEVQKVAESKRSAEEMGENFEGVADQARQADSAMDNVGDTTGDVNRSWGKLGRQGAALSGILRMLTSGVMLLGSRMATLGGFSLGSLIGGGITGRALRSLLPSIGIGAMLSGLSVTGLLKLLPVISIGALLGGLAGGELGKLLGHENIGKLLGALTGAALAAKFGTVALSALVTRMGATTLATYLGSVSIGAILGKIGGAAAGAGGSLAALLGTVGLGTIVAGVGSIALLIGGVASLGDLVDGDISSWNLPAKFGKALGEGFRDAWPNMADTIRTGMTNNIFHDAGQVVGREGVVGSMTGGAGKLERDTAAFLDPRQGWEWTGFQSGGMVEETGPAILHENEAVLPRGLVDAIMSGAGGGGGGGGVNIENQVIEIGDQSMDLSQLSRRDLETLADMIASKQGGELERRV